MRINIAEVRLAWAGLILLAVFAYPSPPAPGPFVIGVILLAFLPGTLVILTCRGQARVTDGLTRLLTQTAGRLSLLAAALLTILLTFSVDAFVACTLIGLWCSLLWAADLLFRSTAWERRFKGGITAALTGFLALVAIDGALNWGPVARRLGTPAEEERWVSRYRPPATPRNFFGFRSPYEDTRRKPGVRRIIALGDSFTWGSKIADPDSSWPALLERSLSQAPGGGPTEVVNMGHGGFATGNEQELLDRIGWQFHPDLVIVQWLDNDAYETAPGFRVRPSPFGPDAIVLVPEKYRSGWIQHSAILRLLERALSARLINVLDLDRKQFGHNAPGWLAQQQSFRAMGDSAARHCTPLLLVLYPYLFPGRWTPDTYPEREIHQRVADAGRSAGLEVLDLLPTFLVAGKDLKEWWATAYDSHPGGEAQVVAAKAIAAHIEAHHLLAERPQATSGCLP